MSRRHGVDVGCFGLTRPDEDLQVGLRLRHVGSSGGGGGMMFFDLCVGRALVQCYFMRGV